MLTYVVPDIHGMINLLHVALHKIHEHAGGDDHKVIFLGDYIDRGLGSAEVVQIIRSGIAVGKPWVALKGNHEDFMAVSIPQPDGNMAWSWMMNGGRETIASYGGDTEKMVDDAKWMEALPVFHQDDHRVYVHAFAPEEYDLENAPEHVMLWSRYPSGADVGYRGKHVVHGHTPNARGPELYENRTNLDCGAVFVGRLVVGVFDSTAPGGPIATIEAIGAKQ